jgi:hypothetical protein
LYFKNLDQQLIGTLSALEEATATEIESNITAFMAYDLQRYLDLKEVNRCVLFFNTYELLWSGRNESEKYSVDSLVRKMAENLPNCLFVISGREKLRWNECSPIWDSKIELVPIDVLESRFAKMYLDSYEIEEDKIQESIINATKGHPYYLDLCVDTYYKLKNSNKEIGVLTFGYGFREIEERFFKSLAKNEISMLKVLSIPRFYDAELFENLVERFKTGLSIVDFDSFNSFSFIKCDTNNKYYIHILMREEVSRNISKELKKLINQSMITYYETKLFKADLFLDDTLFYFSELLYTYLLHLKTVFY